MLVALRARNPQAVERIGSILGEEGGEDAAGLDDPNALGKAAPTVR